MNIRAARGEAVWNLYNNGFREVVNHVHLFEADLGERVLIDGETVW